ncbi:MAG: ABC transporter ATP-binding protein [Candidatus Parvarchaeota archaeon]
MDKLLEVKNLRVNFVTRSGLVNALNGVDFEIYKGETLGLIGETGCGKSVTALSIMNLIPETEGIIVDGEILFEGKDLAKMQRDACKIVKAGKRWQLKCSRSKIAKINKFMGQIRGSSLSMIFQEPTTILNPVMSIRKQMEDALFEHHIDYLASRIIARRRISKEQLETVANRIMKGGAGKYLSEYVKDVPELGPIKDQISYILDRNDISEMRKRTLIIDLSENNKPISKRLVRMSKKNYTKAPRLIPLEIREEAKAVAIELLTKVGIPSPEKILNSYPHELSGGMKQRVAIAIAISSRPKLLIADEPTTALDVTIQAQILDIMKSLKASSNMSILFITHDLGVIASFADRIIVMYAGRVVETSTTKELFKNPKHPYTRGMLMSIPSYGTGREKLKSIMGSVPNLINLPAGCTFHERCEVAMDVCKRKEPPIVAVSEGHTVACWLYEQSQGGSK